MSDLPHILDEGSGPVVLCLHGFPQNASAFDEVAGRLVSTGYRVVRFNQRGYTEGTTDGRRRDYVVSRLAADAIAVLDHLGIQSCVVVGHDLGGMVAWEIGRTAPSRVERLVVVGVPHPGAFLLSLAGITQVFRSWYFILAQSTRVANAVYSPKRPASRERFSTRLHRTGLTPDESAKYLDYLSQGTLFNGAIRWYQAMPFTPLRCSLFRTNCLATIVWGDSDRVTGRLAISLSRLFSRGGQLQFSIVEGGTHWLLDHQSAAVARAAMTTAPSKES